MEKISSDVLKNDLVRALTKAARAAGAVLMHYRSRALNIRRKRGAGIVTDADCGAERSAMRILREARPGFSILTEESAPRARPGAEGRWIMDPLDGTTNFAHGFQFFCVSIAAEIDGRIMAGVIYQPVTGELYCALRGGGAWLDGKRMRVSGTNRLDDALLSTGFSYKHRNKSLLGVELGSFERMSRAAGGIRRAGSAALDLALTARGVFDGFWERNLAPWDVSAGALLVMEAGGMVTDFSGKPFDPFARRIIASNGSLHRKMLHRI
ncbi:MAG: hypothetical protein A2583_01770 [Bdellovibrionales bacterium RIFOXYD1_FULL_53_11]|nr:MAG: hypothetical protein A2583_01770 [Bdellovibrionales bacterium RIFOXYD1_FULL_53_11]